MLLFCYAFILVLNEFRLPNTLKPKTSLADSYVLLLLCVTYNPLIVEVHQTLCIPLRIDAAPLCACVLVTMQILREESLERKEVVCSHIEAF